MGVTLRASRLALREGIGFHVGGGFHHAFPDHGEGFCALHDVGVAIRALAAEGAILRAMVVDLDAHQGNGTATIFPYIGFDMDGGAASAALPHARFGAGPIRNTSFPPPAISAWLNHGRLSGLPLSVADWM